MMANFPNPVRLCWWRGTQCSNKGRCRTKPHLLCDRPTPFWSVIRAYRVAEVPNGTSRSVNILTSQPKEDAMLNMRTSQSRLYRRSRSHLYAPLSLHQLITASSCTTAYTRVYHDLISPIRAFDRHNLEPRTFYSKIIDLKSVETEEANHLVNY